MIDWEDDIKRYYNGEMTPEEEHALERKALNDPFLAEALEGASMISSQEFSEDVSEIKKKIHQKTKKKIWLWPLRIAASVALLVITYFVITPLFERQPDQKLALQKSETTDQKKEEVGAANDTTIHLLEEDSQRTTDQMMSAEQKRKSTKADTKIYQQEIATAEPVTVNPAQVSEAPGEDKLTEKEVEKALMEGDKMVASQEEMLKSKAEAQGARAEEKQAVSRSRMLTNYQRVVQGKVLSAEDDTPIPGVNVVIKGTTTGTVTDMSGHYKLTITSTEPTLVYSFIGLQTEEVEVKDQTDLTVKLQSDVAQLSEVVVTGYSPYRTDDAREPVIKLAEPAGGKRAYDKYLQNSIRYPQQALENKVKGRVTVQFTVRADGSLDEFNVIKGLGHGCDEEVMRLVKQGPKWSPTTEDSVPVESEVRVRVKFALPD